MRIRRKPWARPELESCNFFEPNPENYKGVWKAKFTNNSSPLYLELGCGKGIFTSKIAARNLAFNYIGLDIKDEMLVLAKRNVEKEYNGSNLPINNIILAAYDISRISNIFNEKDTAEGIYINFCNPWPRAKHKKRRLTHPKQLKQYRIFLKDDGKIYFKTDDNDLFTDSKNYFKECNFKIIYETKDLLGSGLKNNIETEHEQMFKAAGKTIKYLVAQKLPQPEI